MIVWLKREKVEKSDGHIAWVDLYQDTETNIQYFGMQSNLCVRYAYNGTPYIGTPVPDTPSDSNEK